jgi:uncharacterized protein
LCVKEVNALFLQSRFPVTRALYWPTMNDVQPEEFTPEPQTPPLDVKAQRPFLRWAALAVVVVIAYVSLFAAGGEFLLFAFSGVQIVPFVLLACSAYLGQERRWAKGTTIAWWAVCSGFAALISLIFTLASLVDPQIWAGLAEGSEVVPIEEMFTTDQLIRILLTVVGASFAFILGALCFLPPVRRGLARLLPIDSQSFVHATGLATVVTLSLLAFTPLAISGQPPLLAMLKDPGFEDSPPQEQLRSALYGLIWAVPASLFAVGFPRKRNLMEACNRLGLVWPRRREVLLASAGAIALAAVIIPLNALFLRLWNAMGWNTTDEKALEVLFSFALGPVGAVVVALTAGLGEEIAFRGVLQPRLGILLSTLLFTATHAFQYNFDALMLVMLLGLLFGVIRKFSNTTMSAIVHGGYDFTLLLVSWLT